MWPRIDGLRTLELGPPGALRTRLDSLALSGRKTTTTGLFDEYERQGEILETPRARGTTADDGTLVVCLAFRLLTAP
ncbi:hypothetical protein ABZX85_15025 [Streptomyces sp. NPDC004539]|uniref:hypothetical protein n=1 Tax=Streptomyces sp. NPDC004539 TaxID=3154280 RepID=UPI0033A3D31B